MKKVIVCQLLLTLCFLLVCPYLSGTGHPQTAMRGSGPVEFWVECDETGGVKFPDEALYTKDEVIQLIKAGQECHWQYIKKILELKAREIVEPLNRLGID